MPQRQPRLGDILDDYCPRERRLTNHAVVAMIGETVRLTRCTTCDAEHDYKEGKLPRPRKKVEAGALAVPAVFVPKRVVHEPKTSETHFESEPLSAAAPVGDVAIAVAPLVPDVDAPLVDLESTVPVPHPAAEPVSVAAAEALPVPPVEEGPVHRQLIRAQLPRHEGQPVVQRPTADFTIRQPTGGRHNRFRPRGARHAGNGFQGPSFRATGGNNNSRGNGPRPAGQPPMVSRLTKRQGPPPRKRSK